MTIIKGKCPSGPKWNGLVNRIGEREAYGVWMEHGGEVPDPMLYPKPRFPGDFEHVWHEPFDGIKDYTAMTVRKKELENSGAKVSIQGNGLRVSVNPVEKEKVRGDYAYGIYPPGKVPSYYKNSPDYKQKLPTDKQRKYELQQRIADGESGRDSSAIGQALYRISKVYGRGQGTSPETGRFDQQDEKREQQVWEKINAGNLRYLGRLEDLTQYKVGTENTVYFRKGDKDNVVKINKVEEISLPEYLKRLIIHNKYFPNAKYTLLGFIYKDNKVLPVVEQKYIRGNGEYDQVLIDNYLSVEGFEKLEFDRFRDKKIGIGIEDVNPANVIIKDGKPYFIDPVILINHKRLNEPVTGVNSRLESPNIDLDKQVKSFLNSVGFNVKHVPDGNYAGMADTINKIIEVVDGKADITTLPHEATHVLLDLLPDNSPILKEILHDVGSRIEYKDIYDQYEHDPEYQNADGSVNQEKMAKETAAHIIDDIIAGKFKEKAVLRWWQKLWRWIVSKLKGKNLSAYEQVAEDILNNDSSRLDLNKEGTGKYKQLTPDQISKAERDRVKLKKEITQYVKTIRDKSSTSDSQKAIIDGIVLKEGVPVMGLHPSPKVDLNDADHVYKDEAGIVYNSTTKKITGEFSPDKAAEFELNKDAGNDIDILLTAATLGKSFKEITRLSIPTLPDEHKTRLYADMLNFVDQITSNGEIAIPQVIVSDPASKTAGSIDLYVIDQQGNGIIYDLKSSINEVKSGESGTYLSEWQQNPGSVFNGLTYYNGELIPRKEGDQPVKLSKKLQHAIQIGSYGRMGELQGVPTIGLYSKHINVELDHMNWKLKSYKDEGVIAHDIEENKPYIDQVVPTQVDTNNLSDLQKDRDEYNVPEAPIEEPISNEYHQPLDTLPASKAMGELIQKNIGDLVEWMKYTKGVSANPILDDATIYKYSQLKDTIASSIREGRYSSLLQEYMTISSEQAKAVTDYLNDKDRLDKHLGQYIDVCVRARNFLEVYRDIAKSEYISQLTPEQQQKFGNMLGELNKMENAINTGLSDSIFKTMRDNGDHNYTEDEIDKAVYGGSVDIGILERMLLGPTMNNSPLVYQAHYFISKAVFNAIEQSRDDIAQLDKPLTSLKTVSGTDQSPKAMYSYMVDYSKGQFRRRESIEFEDHVQDAKDTLIDPASGERRSPRAGNNLSKEDLAYNLQLRAQIDAVTNLTRAEQFIWDDQAKEGHYTSGDYYELAPYTEYNSGGTVKEVIDFEQQRAYFEFQNNYGVWTNKYAPDRATKYIYSKEDGKDYVTNKETGEQIEATKAQMDDLEALKYRYRCKIPVPDEYEWIKDDKGDFTGQVLIKPKGSVKWVIKPQFKKLRDTSSESTGKRDLRDPLWVAMQADNSPKGIARKEFYNKFMELRHKYSLTFPESQRVSYMKYLDAKPTGAYQKLKEGKFKEAGKSIKGAIGQKLAPFSSAPYQETVHTDASGNVQQTVPLYSPGRYNEKKIKKLERDLKELQDRAKGVAGTSREKINKDIANKQGQLKAEKAKTKIEDINPDIMSAIKDSSTNINLHKNITEVESKVLAIEQVAQNKVDTKGYELTDGAKRTLFQKVGNSIEAGIKAFTDMGGMSNELARIKELIAMYMYKNYSYKDSVWAKVEGLPITLSALALFKFNIPVSFGVFSIGMWTHGKEAVVGEFFKPKQFLRAQKEYSVYTKNFVANNAMKVTGKGKKYADKFDYFATVTQGFDKGRSTPERSGDVSLEHFVEHATTMIAGAALAMNTPIKGDDGTISNMYDVVKYDKSTGQGYIQKGFEQAFEEKKYWMYSHMQEYQNRFHGPFGEMQTLAVTMYPLGRSFAYLHKAIFATIQRMFSSPWTQGHLGYSEGQWYTSYNLVRMMYQYEGTLRDKMNSGWRDIIPKGAIGNKNYHKLNEQERKTADDKAYSEDKEFVNPDGSLKKDKIERDKQIRSVRLNNLKRDLAQIVSICILFAAYELFKSMAEDSEDSTRRWNNFIAKSFDRLRKVELFGLPVVGIEEQYNFIKSPIASMGVIRDFAGAISATVGLAIPGVEDKYVTGVHTGQYKASVKLQKALPVLNMYPYWEELNNANYWIK